MKVTPTGIPDVLIVEPEVFGDDRGFFYESFNKAFKNATGLALNFVQDNHSKSLNRVLRGLHSDAASTRKACARDTRHDL